MASPGSADTTRIAYVCRMLGTPDHDRCNALSEHFAAVLAVNWRKEIGYRWDFSDEKKYDYVEVDAEIVSIVAKMRRMLSVARTLLKHRTDIVIIYGYQDPYLFLLGAIMRLMRSKVVSINDSKFDDYDRSIFTDFLKVLTLLPYTGYLAASDRAASYLRYLGCSNIAVYRCAINIDRVKALSSKAERISFGDRPFIAIARFVPKKNHQAILSSYETYASMTPAPRRLVLVGYGQLEDDIRRTISNSPTLSSLVDIRGYQTADEIPQLLATCVALLLLSNEEQFGIVITEALACGIPVIASPSCGASEMISCFRNGFVVRPEEKDSVAKALAAISSDESSWLLLSEEARRTAQLAHVSLFVSAILSVTS